MKDALKAHRIPFQIIALLLQTFYIIKLAENALRAEGEDAWFGFLFTLFIVIACETVSLVDAVLLVITRHNAYSFIYSALFIVNAVFFLKINFYDTVGTVIGLLLYAALYILRIVNVVLNFKDIHTPS